MVHVGVVLLIIINLLIKPTVLTAMVRSTELYVENVCQNVVRVHSRYSRPDPAVSVKIESQYLYYLCYWSDRLVCCPAAQLAGYNVR